MKKIAILTLYGYFNYGNKYQNYAVTQIVKKYGYTPETIVVYPDCKQSVRHALLCLKSLSGNTDARRYLKIYRFSKKNIPVRIIIKKDMQIPHTVANQYDYFIAGSDQVWNPSIRPKERQNFFLSFANKEQRICISPSFGVNKIDEEFREIYIQGLNGFNNLCSRESTGVEIIKSLTGKDAELLIDPTLALTKEDWKKVFTEAPKQKSDYLVLAALSELSDDKREYVNSLSQKYNLKIVDIFDKNEAYGPDEVLSLISNAKLVFTDSFHFTAFSVNFNVPFIVLRREDHVINSAMFIRMTSLLEMFGLEGRLFENVAEGKELTCDFSYANQVLEQQRIKFFNYLDRSLNKNES